MLISTTRPLWATPPVESRSATRGNEIWVAAERCGRPLMEWQREVLDQACEVTPSGGWRRHTVTVICPRRNGKSYMVAWRIVVGILRYGERSVLYSAHRADTARAVLDEVWDILRSDTRLFQHVRAKYAAAGRESIHFRNGAVFSIRTRTKSGGRGLGGDLVILDEALELSTEAVDALTPLLAEPQSRGRGQLWILSSAGHAESSALARFRASGIHAAKTGDSSVVYVEYAAPAEAEADDRAAWALANPALGVTITEDFLAQQHSRLSEDGFAREHLGRWSDQSASPFVEPAAWAACGSAEPVEPTGQPVMALDQHWQTNAQAVIAWPGGSGIIALLADEWSDVNGLDMSQVAAEVAELAGKYGIAQVALDRWTGSGLAEHLQALGMPVRTYTLPMLTDAAAELSAAVTARRLTHNEDERLTAQVLAAGRALTPDGIPRLSRKTASGICAGAYALAMAVRETLHPNTGPEIH